MREGNPRRPRFHGEAADPGTELLALIEMTINRVFSISLILAAANESLGDHPTSGRLAEAVERMDALIRDLRLAAFARHPRDAAEVDAVQEHIRRGFIAMIEAWPLEGPASAESLGLADQLSWPGPPSPDAP